MNSIFFDKSKLKKWFLSRYSNTNISISNISPIEAIIKLRNDIEEMVGVNVMICTPNSEVIADIKMTKHCNIMRSTPEGCLQCKLSVNKSKSTSYYFCNAGVYNAIIDITLFDINIGYVKIGQIRTPELDERREYQVKSFAKRVKVNPEELWEGYKALPVKTPEEMEQSIKLTKYFINNYIDYTIQQIYQTKINEENTKLKESLYNTINYDNLFNNTAEYIIIAQDNEIKKINNITNKTFNIDINDDNTTSSKILYTHYIHPDDLVLIPKIIDNQLQENSVSLQIRLKISDNTYHWFNIIAINYTFNKRAAIAIFMFDNDEEYKAHKETEKSEQWYRTLAHSGETLITVLNTDFVYTFVNDNTCTLFDVEREEIIGMNLTKYKHLSQVQKLIKALHKVHDTKDKVNYISEFNNLKTGKQVWLNNYITPILDEDRNVTGYLHQATNVTEIKESELKLKESQRKNKELANSGNAFVAIINTDFRITYANQQLLAFIGKKEEDVIGTQHIITTHPEDDKLLAETFFKCNSSYTPNSVEYRMLRCDGVWCWMHSTLSPFFDSNNQYCGIIFNSYEITKHKETEFSLREQNNLYEQLINSGDIYTIKFTPDLIVTYANKQIVDLYNLKLSDILGKHMKDAFEFVPTELSNSVKQQRKGNFEFYIASHDIYVSAYVTPLYNTRGDVVEYLYQSLDITNKTKTEQKLKDLLTKYNQVINSDEIFTLQCDKNRVITYINDTMAEFYGQKAEDMQGKTIEEVIDYTPDVINEMLTKDTKSKCEVYIPQLNRHLRAYISPIRNANGDVVEHLYRSIDITQEKRTSITLQKSEAKYREIYESLQDVFFAIDLDGNILELSPSLSSMSNGILLPEKYISKNIKSIKDLAFINSDRYINKITDKKVINDEEYSFDTPHLQDKTFSFSSKLIFDKNGNPTHIIGTVRDITARKKAEQELTEQQKLYSSIMQLLPAGAYRKDNNYKYTFVNNRLFSRFGIEEKDMLGRNAEEVYNYQQELIAKKLLPTDALILSKQWFHTFIDNETGITTSEDYQLFDLAGNIYYVKIMRLPLYDKQKRFIGSQGLLIETTKEKLNYIKLQQTNNELDIAINKARIATELYDLAPTGYASIDENGLILEINNSFSEIFSVKKHNIVGKNLCSLLSTEDGNKFNMWLNELHNNRDTMQCTEISQSHNKLTYIRCEGVFSSTTNTFLISFIDVTDLRNIEFNLHKQKELFNKSERISHSCSWRLNKANNELIFSEEIYNLLGNNINYHQLWNELTKGNREVIKQYIHEDNIDAFMEYVRNVTHNNKSASIEFKLNNAYSKAQKWFYAQTENKLDSNGNLTERIGFIIDINQRKENELALVEQKKSLRNILDASSDGVILISDDNLITDISTNACKQFNTNIQKLGIQTTIFDIFPDAERDKMFNQIENTKDSHKLYNEEYVIPSIDNETDIYEIVTKEVILADEKRIMLNIRNVSERKRMTQHMIRSERLVSLGEMATAMAHEINQPLLSISFSVDNMLDRLKLKAPEQMDYIQRKTDLIFSDISRISRLIDHVRAFARDQNNEGSEQLILLHLN